MMDIVKKHELFKLQWMIDHGYTLEDLMKELDKLKRESPLIDLPMLFDHWQFDVGFGSEIWPCFDEWKEWEGRENTIRIVDVVDKIATFLEDEEHWRALRCCWLENGQSDDLRKLLTAAMK